MGKGRFKNLLLTAGFLLLNSTFIEGAELFRIQSGTVTMANTGVQTVTVDIESVCTTQSFLIFSSSTDSADPQNFQIGGEITNSSLLTFNRWVGASADTEVTIKWQVFEFEGNVTVQRGVTNLNGANTINETITAVDLTKSFVTTSMTQDGSTYGNNDGATADLTTTTNLAVSASSNNATFFVYWQVIEYDDAVVKKFNTTLSAGSASTTTTITPAIGTLSKAMVISSHTVASNANADDLPRTELTNSSTVTYTRGVGTAADMDFVTYVVEFTDQTTVARGSQAFASGSTSETVSITAPPVSSGVFGPGNFGRQGSTSHATDDNMGHAWFTYEIVNRTNMLIERAVGTSSTADVPYQIVTFEDLNTGQETYYSFATGNWEDNTSWTLTSDGSSGAVAAGVFPRRNDDVVIRSGHTITIDAG